MVLAGGVAARLDGADKPSLELHGRTLLTWALDAVVDAQEVVVVAAALLTGRDALLDPPPLLAVLACDMPYLTSSTFRRLREASAGRDGAVLAGPDGRRQAAMVLDLERLDAVRPSTAEQHGLALHRLLAPLDLVDVAAQGQEHRDVDTWTDVRDLT